MCCQGASLRPPPQRSPQRRVSQLPICRRLYSGPAVLFRREDKQPAGHLCPRSPARQWVADVTGTLPSGLTGCTEAGAGACSLGLLALHVLPVLVSVTGQILLSCCAVSRRGRRSRGPQVLLELGLVAQDSCCGVGSLRVPGKLHCRPDSEPLLAPDLDVDGGGLGSHSSALLCPCCPA